MSAVWAESVRRCLAEAVESLGEAVRDCPDGLWRVPMWRVRPDELAGEVYDGDGGLITDPARREARVQRWSQPWSVAWHALEVLDYDLAGELEPWTPPAPFAGNPHWRTLTSLPEPWSKAQVLGYVEHCRQRVDGLREERAATPLPAAHRYAGRPYAAVVTGLIGHTTAHAVQVRCHPAGRTRPVS